MIEETVADIPLTIPKFSVDAPLGKIPKPLPSTHSFVAFVGPPRSGKTSLSTALLTQTSPGLYYQIFDHVHLFVPLTSFQSMTNSPFAQHDKVHHELTPQDLTSLVTELEASSKAGTNTLVIVDDFMSSLKNSDPRKELERMVCNRRHLRLTLWVITQTYRSIPLSTRKLLSHVLMFRSSNLRELESLRDELVPRDRAEFSALYNHVFAPGGDPHAFMYLDIGDGRIYNRFNEMHFRPQQKI
jgi:GTPase SAR1 family protein